MIQMPKPPLSPLLTQVLTSSRLRKTMLASEKAPEEIKIKSYRKKERTVHQRCGTSRRPPPLRQTTVLRRLKTRNPNSSTGKRVSQKKEHLMQMQIMLLIKSRLMVLILLSSLQKSKDSARIIKSNATDLKDRTLRPTQLLRMARQKEKQVKRMLMEKHKNLEKRRSQAILALKRPKILFTRIQWSSRKPKNSNPNGRNTDLVIGGKVAAKHLLRSKLRFHPCQRNYLRLLTRLFSTRSS